MPATPLDPVLTLAEAIDMLPIGTVTAYQQARKGLLCGAIPVFRITPKKYGVFRKDVDAFLAGELRPQAAS